MPFTKLGRAIKARKLKKTIPRRNRNEPLEL